MDAVRGWKILKTETAGNNLKGIQVKLILLQVK